MVETDEEECLFYQGLYVTILLLLQGGIAFQISLKHKSSRLSNQIAIHSSIRLPTSRERLNVFHWLRRAPLVLEVYP